TPATARPGRAAGESARIPGAAGPSTARSSPRTEQRVDDDRGPRRAKARALDRYGELFQALPVRRRIAAQLLRVADQRHAHGYAERGELAGRDEAVAAVVAGPAHDQHRAVAAPLRERGLGHRAAGALHQELAGHAEHLDRVAIEGAHRR